MLSYLCTNTLPKSNDYQIINWIFLIKNTYKLTLYTELLQFMLADLRIIRTKTFVAFSGLLQFSWTICWPAYAEVVIYISTKKTICYFCAEFRQFTYNLCFVHHRLTSDQPLIHSTHHCTAVQQKKNADCNH